MFSYAVQHNMYADDMDSLTGQYMVQGLVNYVIASLNNHPDKPLEQLKEEFYSFFGTAKEPIREYFDYVTDLTMKKGFRDSALEQSGIAEGGMGLARYMIRVGDSLFTPEVMAKCFGMLDAAAKTPGLDEVSARRILMLRHGMEQLKLAMAAEAEYRKAARGAPPDGFYAAYAKLLEFRKSLEPTCLINLGQLHFYDDLAWLKPIRENTWRKTKQK